MPQVTSEKKYNRTVTFWARSPFNYRDKGQYGTLFLPLEALFSMREDLPEHVKDVLQGSAQQRTDDRNQGLGWGHYCPTNQSTACMFRFRTNPKLNECLKWIINLF